MNEYLKNNKIKDFVIDILIDALYDYEDTIHYSCDLPYDLLERYSIDGVYFNSNYKAIKFIKENFDDFGEIVKKTKFQLGADAIPNVFDTPDRFCVVCFLEVASYLCGNCKFICNNWDNKITLNKENIEIIKKELNELKG